MARSSAGRFDAACQPPPVDAYWQVGSGGADGRGNKTKYCLFGQRLRLHGESGRSGALLLSTCTLVTRRPRQHTVAAAAVHHNAACDRFDSAADSTRVCHPNQHMLRITTPDLFGKGAGGPRKAGSRGQLTPPSDLELRSEIAYGAFVSCLNKCIYHLHL